uniref:Uncharacterized protein n=1 Tax=Meloidogyne enterolobii TaxID=390850 RepID=A0A6V7UUU8_MELEN|nr:unnamed protein product [Meloidogyne enterolobii]
MSPLFSSKNNFSLFQTTLILLLLISQSQSVFYRKIPFRYKSVVEKPWTNTEDDNIAAAILTSREDKEEGEQNIAQLLEQIEKSSLDSPDNDIEEDYTNLKEDILPLNQKLQKINNNLIKQRTDKNGDEVIALPKNILIEKEDILPKYTHLMAFRPDYTIRNFASFLRRFLDSRIIAATVDDETK